MDMSINRFLDPNKRIRGQCSRVFLDLPHPLNLECRGNKNDLEIGLEFDRVDSLKG